MDKVKAKALARASLKNAFRYAVYGAIVGFVASVFAVILVDVVALATHSYPTTPLFDTQLVSILKFCGKSTWISAAAFALVGWSFAGVPWYIGAVQLVGMVMILLSTVTLAAMGWVLLFDWRHAPDAFHMGIAAFFLLATLGVGCQLLGRIREVGIAEFQS